jgi:hypothetical protein
MNFDYGSIKPGYKNPLGGSGSIKGDYDWGSFSKGTDWSQRPGLDRSGLFESLFDKSRNTDKYRSRAERGFDSDNGFRADRAFGGELSKGGGGQILENLGAIYPQQHSPMYLPGQQGERGMFSKIAGVAAPFASLIPGVGPVVSAGLGAASQTGW